MGVADRLSSSRRVPRGPVFRFLGGVGAIAAGRSRRPWQRPAALVLVASAAAIGTLKRRRSSAANEPIGQVFEPGEEQEGTNSPSSGDHDKTEKANRELPDKVDHEEHSNLLEEHGIEPKELLGKLGF